MSPERTRVVSATRSRKMSERWANARYAERARARLRAQAAEQREAVQLYRRVQRGELVVTERATPTAPAPAAVGDDQTAAAVIAVQRDPPPAAPAPQASAPARAGLFRRRR